MFKYRQCVQFVAVLLSLMLVYHYKISQKNDYRSMTTRGLSVHVAAMMNSCPKCGLCDERKQFERWLSRKSRMNVPQITIMIPENKTERIGIKCIDEDDKVEVCEFFPSEGLSVDDIIHKSLSSLGSRYEQITPNARMVERCKENYIVMTWEYHEYVPEGYAAC